MTDSTMDNGQELPAGYVSLGPVSLHRHDLSRYTTDLDRFLENLPQARELYRCEPETPESRAIWESAENRTDLLLTVQELSEFLHAVARTWQVMQSAESLTH